MAGRQGSNRLALLCIIITVPAHGGNLHDGCMVGKWGPNCDKDCICPNPKNWVCACHTEDGNLCDKQCTQNLLYISESKDDQGKMLLMSVPVLIAILSFFTLVVHLRTRDQRPPPPPEPPPPEPRQEDGDDNDEDKDEGEEEEEEEQEEEEQEYEKPEMLWMEGRMSTTVDLYDDTGTIISDTAMARSWMQMHGKEANRSKTRGAPGSGSDASELSSSDASGDTVCKSAPGSSETEEEERTISNIGMLEVTIEGSRNLPKRRKATRRPSTSQPAERPHPKHLAL